MAYAQQVHRHLTVADVVDHAVIANADAVAFIVAFELRDACRTWIAFERLNLGADARLRVRVELIELLLKLLGEKETIGAIALGGRQLQQPQQL
jgi:hypothetical protein